MRKTLNEGFDKLFEGICKEDLESDIAMYQKRVDDDIAKYGKISGRTRVALDKSGLDLQRDPEEGNFVVVKRNDDSIEVTKDFMPYGFQFPSKDDSKLEKAMHSIRGVLANAGRDKLIEIANDFDTCTALGKDPSELSTPVIIETILTAFQTEMNTEEIFNTLTNYGIDASFRASHDTFPVPQGVPDYPKGLADILSREDRDTVLGIAYDYFGNDQISMPNGEHKFPSELSTQVLAGKLATALTNELSAVEIADFLDNFGVSLRGWRLPYHTVEGVENGTDPSDGKEPLKESFYSTEEVLKLVSPRVKDRLQRIIDTQKQKYGNDMEIEVSISSPYKAHLNYGEGGADYVKGDDGMWTHDYGYITINPVFANAILSDVCSATGACDEAKKCKAVNEGETDGSISYSPARMEELFNKMLGYLVELISDDEELRNVLEGTIGFTKEEIDREGIFDDEDEDEHFTKYAKDEELITEVKGEKNGKSANSGKPTKIFKVAYIETLQYDENIEAKSEREAIAEFKRMQEEGEIDYSDGVLVDSKYEAKVSDLVYEGKGKKK